MYFHPTLLGVLHLFAREALHASSNGTDADALSLALQRTLDVRARPISLAVVNELAEHCVQIAREELRAAYLQNVLNLALEPHVSQEQREENALHEARSFDAQHAPGAA